MNSKVKKPFKVFITYSHKDKQAKDDLVEAFAVMVQNDQIGLGDEIVLWHDGKLIPGDEWREAILNNLKEADILLYLVSRTSLASKNSNKELVEALSKIDHRINTIPVILEPCDWQKHQLGEFQALPKNGKPISMWDHPEDGWQSVVNGIREVVRRMSASTQPGARKDLFIESYSKSDVYVNRGTVKLSLNRHKEALADYDKAIRLNLQHADAYLSRGNVKLNLGCYEEAIKDLDRAVRLDPQHADAYLSRGNVKQILGAYSEALADYKEAIKINPQQATVYSSSGFAKIALCDYKGAIVDFDEAIRLNPQNANTYHARGVTNDMLKRYREAINDFNKVIKLDPNFARAYYNRGRVKQDLDRYSEAIADFDRAIELDPLFAEIYNSRGIAKSDLSQNEEAVLDFNRAIRLDPTFARAFNNRAKAYLMLRKDKNARADLEKALRLSTEQSNQELAQATQKALGLIPKSFWQRVKDEQKYQIEKRAKKKRP